MNEQILFMGSSFGAVAFFAYFVSQLMLNRGTDEKLRDRLSGRVSARAVAAPRQNLRSILQRIGQAAAQPVMPQDREKQSALRKNLARAGIYSPSAIRVATGAKVICLASGVIGGYLVGVSMDKLWFGV